MNPTLYHFVDMCLTVCILYVAWDYFRPRPNGAPFLGWAVAVFRIGYWLGLRNERRREVVELDWGRDRHERGEVMY